MGSSSPQHITQVGIDLYMYANDGVHGFQLFRLDGSTERFSLVRISIRPVTAVRRSRDVHRLQRHPHFRDFAVRHRGLVDLASDGTDAGTYRLKEINVGGDD